MKIESSRHVVRLGFLGFFALIAAAACSSAPSERSASSESGLVASASASAPGSVCTDRAAVSTAPTAAPTPTTTAPGSAAPAPPPAPAPIATAPGLAPAGAPGDAADDGDTMDITQEVSTASGLTPLAGGAPPGWDAACITGCAARGCGGAIPDFPTCKCYLTGGWKWCWNSSCNLAALGAGGAACTASTCP